jgi:hypothetical protein
VGNGQVHLHARVPNTKSGVGHSSNKLGKSTLPKRESGEKKNFSFRKKLEQVSEPPSDYADPGRLGFIPSRNSSSLLFPRARLLSPSVCCVSCLVRIFVHIVSSSVRWSKSRRTAIGVFAGWARASRREPEIISY